MLHTIFGKTLYEKRWSTLAWAIALFLMTILVVVLFPTFRESLGKSLQDVPESMRSFLGDASTYQRITGYLDVQVYTQMVFMTVVMGVILGSGLIAGEEGEGTLQSLLTQPVSRQKVYRQKLLALAAVVGIACLTVMVGAYLGVLLIGESLSLLNLFWATVMTWLVTLVFSLLAYCLGAVTGRRGLAGAVAGALAFVSLLITSLSQGVKFLHFPNNFSPFNYFNKPSALEAGLQVNDLLILAAICVVFSIIGYTVFVKRDVFQH